MIVNAYGADEWRGGVERGVAVAARALAERGVEVSLLRADAGEEVDAAIVARAPRRGRASPFGRRIGNRIRDFGAVRNGELDLVVAASGADLMHSHNLPGLTTAVWAAAERAGMPVVHGLHDYYLLCPRSSLTKRDGTPCGFDITCALRTKLLLRPAGAVKVVTGVSQWLVDAHRQLFPTARFEVLRNPMMAFERDEMRPPAGESPTIGYIGGLTREKGIPELVAAAEILSDFSCRFQIGGHGKLAELVETAARRLPNVTFTGTVTPDLKRDFIEGCDVGIIPSVWAEPGGPTHALAEWLTAGRPALVTTRGGLGEAATFSPGAIPLIPTVEGIVEGVKALLSPESWREAVGSVGSWDPQDELDKWIDSHVGIYESLLSPASSLVR